MKDNFRPSASQPNPPDKDGRSQDLTLLVEQHAKEVWALKQDLSKAVQELTTLNGARQVVASLSNELVRMKKRAQEAEEELTIIKGIGKTPEVKTLQAKINELEGTLGSAQDINDNHQRYNGKLQVRVTELEADNKKLSRQISDHIKKHEDKFRKAGL
jgi:chromosome segregation ATPase